MRPAALVLLVLTVAACATLPADNPSILAALQSSVESWNRGDLKGHLAIYDETVTMMTRSGPRAGVAPIEASFGSNYFKDGKPRQSLRVEQMALRPLSRESALMTGRFVLSGGAEAEQSGWFTLIWLRTASGWRVVHDHSS
jgi:ketosteroid isomerase-like protein